jgi:endogenous inhibitor of DNA gyrase (YacG/DUF329 family)
MTIMTAAEGTGLCVFCRKKPQAHAWLPFCSERCKLQDLAKWAGGDYRIAAAPAAESEDADNHHGQPNSSAPDGQDRQD